MISNTCLLTTSHEVVNIGFPCKSLPEISSQPNPYICISTPPFPPPFPTMSTNLTLPSPCDHLTSTTCNPYVSISTPVHPLPTLPFLCLSPAASHPLTSSLTDIHHAAAGCCPPHLSHHPQPGNRYSASSICPPVPADRCVILSTTPHSLQLHSSLQLQVSLCLHQKIFKKLLSATMDVTQQSYGAGLLSFTQFCDCEQISESLQMPASVILLASFIADSIGTCTGQCIHNWLNGLHLWHLYNHAE